MEYKLITHIDRINFFSEKFISYYTKFFDKQEFLFLINEKNSTNLKQYLKLKNFNEDNFKVIKKNELGKGKVVTLQNEIQKNLLKENYIVVYADIDELIYHPNLKKYIEDTNENLYCPIGIEIIQDYDENFLDEDLPILEQRNKYRKNINWKSKVCILKKEFKWTGGRHNKKNIIIDNNLFLIDIGKICSKIYKENNIYNKSFYTSVTGRYTLIDDNSINLEFDKFRKNLDELKNLDIIKNFF
jgi:hypothetical protein